MENWYGLSDKGLATVALLVEPYNQPAFIRNKIKMQDKSVPFDMTYVMKTTFKHMLNSVNISIDKTFARLPEFEGNPEKSFEVYRTIEALHGIRKSLEEYQNVNPNQFKGYKNHE